MADVTLTIDGREVQAREGSTILDACRRMRIDTPTLWRLAQQGSIGALSVGSAHQPTCPGDGWLTLGAGNVDELAGRLGDES